MVVSSKDTQKTTLYTHLPMYLPMYRNIISKGPKFKFPSYIDFPKCRREIAAYLNDLMIVGANGKMFNLAP